MNTVNTALVPVIAGANAETTVVMNNELIRAACALGLGGRVLGAYVYLLTWRTDSQGKPSAWRSLDAIALDLKMTRPNLCRVMKELEHRGMLNRVKRSGGDRKRVTLYEFLHPDQWEGSVAPETSENSTAQASECDRGETAKSVSHNTDDSLDQDTRVITEKEESHHQISLDDDDKNSSQGKCCAAGSRRAGTSHNESPQQPAAHKGAHSGATSFVANNNHIPDDKGSSIQMMPSENRELLSYIVGSQNPDTPSRPVINVPAYACRSLGQSRFASHVALQWKDTVRVITTLRKYRDVLVGFWRSGDATALAYRDLHNALINGEASLLPGSADIVLGELEEFLRARCKRS